MKGQNLQVWCVKGRKMWEMLSTATILTSWKSQWWFREKSGVILGAAHTLQDCRALSHEFPSACRLNIISALSVCWSHPNNWVISILFQSSTHPSLHPWANSEVSEEKQANKKQPAIKNRKKWWAEEGKEADFFPSCWKSLEGIPKHEVQNK